MKKLTSVVVLFACIFVLMPGAASAEVDFGTWCLDYNLQWDGSTCTVGEFDTPAMSESLTIDPGQTLEIDGTVHIAFGAAEYTITNYGTININSGGWLNNTPPYRTLNNYGTINNSEKITNGGILNNYGTINDNSPLEGGFENLGLLNNLGTFNENSGTLDNILGGTIDNIGRLYNNATIRNVATILNKGFVFNQHGFIVNYGAVYNYHCPGEAGVITAGPTNLDNYGTIEYVNGQECW